jgi:hypothetical protein
MTKETKYPTGNERILALPLLTKCFIQITQGTEEETKESRYHRTS